MLWVEIGRIPTKHHEFGGLEAAQYWPFKCFLSLKDLILFQAKLTEQLSTTQDSVRFYPLCANCVGKVETIGDPSSKDEILFVV